jgi:tetratricopeptide (TPR) repeat protein
MQEIERDFHRKAAVECFNRAWDYLDKKDRTIHDDQLMLHLTHSSRYHWSFVGTPRNLAVGDWQISRVYAALGQPDLSLRFAKTALEIGEKNNLQEVILTAYEAMARAHATGKNYKLASDFIDKAKSKLQTISLDEEDRKIYSDQIEETELMIGR